MATVESKLMTANEFFDFVHRPENQGRFFELERGEVIEMPPPGEVHGTLCSWISHLLWEYILQQRGGKGRITANDTGLMVEQDPDTVRGADLMFFDDSRRVDQLNRGYPTDLPTLVVEVRSPSDSYRKMVRRAGQYLTRGVPMVWLVDPDDQSITVLQLREIPQSLEGSDELNGGELLPGLRRPVADFFALPGESS